MAANDVDDGPFEGTVWRSNGPRANGSCLKRLLEVENDVVTDHVLLAPPFIVDSETIATIVERLGEAVDAALAQVA